MATILNTAAAAHQTAAAYTGAKYARDQQMLMSYHITKALTGLSVREIGNWHRMIDAARLKGPDLQPALDSINAMTNSLIAPQVSKAMSAFNRGINQSLQHLTFSTSITQIAQSLGLWVQQSAVYTAAFAAQEGVASSELERLDRFLRDWLGFENINATVRSAAVTVLLEEDLETLVDNCEPEEFIGRLRKAINRYLYEERFMRGTRTGSGRRELVSLNGTTHGAARDFTSETAFSNLNIIDDPLLIRVLNQVKPNTEKPILLARAKVENWADAAYLCGRSGTDGESVRRKVKRIATRLQQRE